jgi:integrase
MSERTGLVARVLYGTGMRVLEATRLRVKNVDFARLEIVVRDGKGAKDRVTMLPESLVDALRAELAVAQALHRRDLAEGSGRVYLPFALERKYPNASAEWMWQYEFPADRLSEDPRSGCAAVITCIRNRCSVRCAMPFAPPASPSLRRRTRCATRSQRTCSSPATTSARWQELLVHAEVSTTTICTHVLNRGGRGVRSPLGREGLVQAPSADARRVREPAAEYRVPTPPRTAPPAAHVALR